MASGVFVDTAEFFEVMAERAESCWEFNEPRPRPVPGVFSDGGLAFTPILEIPVTDEGAPHPREETPKAPLPANCIPVDILRLPPDCPLIGVAETVELAADPTVDVVVASTLAELLLRIS